ncbi:hypothetical protein GCM10011594_29760 [Nakamurella endophytica]|uniref:Uncharacterized protein n=1 Tax=Nakamurella endophytica TaxID=1748367 RepID=A0A917T252_9ACTN|nr:hypothetical protein GCM10011594_29760 [Nakamurella endophytica]
MVGRPQRGEHLGLEVPGRLPFAHVIDAIGSGLPASAGSGRRATRTSGVLRRCSAATYTAAEGPAQAGPTVAGPVSDRRPTAGRQPWSWASGSR